MSSSLSATLAVVPGVVVTLWLLGVWVRRRGGRVLRERVVAYEFAILALLLLVIRSRSSLGLIDRHDSVDALLAAALALLLMHHVVALLKGMVSVLGDRLPARPPWPFFVLPLLVYVAIIPWATHHREPDGDEPYYLLITHSLAYDLDTELSNNYEANDSLAFMSRELEPEWADPKGPEGRIYSRHNLTLPLILAPGYRAAGKFGAFLTMALLAALVAWMWMRLAARLLPHWVAQTVAAWALLSLTPPFLLYSHQIWTEVPAALLVLVALDEIYALRTRSGEDQGSWLKLTVALALLPLLKLRFVPLAGSLAFLAGWKVGLRRKGLAVLAVVLLLVLGAMLIYNLTVFDRALKDHTVGMLKQIQGRSPLEYLRGGLGLLFDCAFGLFTSNPLWILLIPSLVVAVARASSLSLDVLVCALPYLLIVTPRLEWYGAWAPPFRFGIVVLPVLTLLLIPLFALQWRGLYRPAVTGVGIAALALTLVWLVLPGWTYNPANGTSHLIDHLAKSLGTDIGRFFPSYVRPRSASWLVPVAVVVAAMVVWFSSRKQPSWLGAWGTVFALLLAAALPLGASTLATRVVEFEDLQVSKQGGEVYPDPWVPGRPRFRGGWKLGSGNSLTAPVNVVGIQVDMSIDLQVRTGVGTSARSSSDDSRVGRPRVPGLELRIEDRAVPLEWLSNQAGWQTATAAVSNWRRGAPLEIRFDPSDSDWMDAEIVLDRARFDWR